MDESAFSDYVVARRPQLFRTACLLCGDPHRAEDVVQDALARQGRDTCLGAERVRSCENVRSRRSDRDARDARAPARNAFERLLRGVQVVPRPLAADVEQHG